MFVLEESHLLEDTIVDRDVLDLYKLLRNSESKDEPNILVEGVILSDKGSKFSKILIDYIHEYSQSSPNEKVKITSDEIEKHLKDLNLTSKDDFAALALILAATYNQLFVIDNFLSPARSHPYSKIPEFLVRFANQITYKSLTIDGSEVHHKVISPWLIKLAQTAWDLLDSSSYRRKMLELEFLVWKHRYLTVHLLLLLEPAEATQNQLKKLQEFIFDHHLINDLKDNKTQLTRFNIVELCCELIQSSLNRGGLTFCRRFFDYASELSGITIEHTGALGKRTKFQQNDISQLVIKVSESNMNDHISTVTTDEKADLPLDVKLDDDTLLPDVSFKSGDIDGNDSNLSIEAQLLMLADLEIFLKRETMEESLKDEYALAFLRSLTRSASVWPLKHKALVLRSTIEKKHMRKMDRALRQLEELIKTNQESPTRELNRLRCFYSTLPLSHWQVQRALGDMSFELGLFKNALDLYQKIEYWEGIIKCHCALQQTAKAEAIIRQELAKNESAYLYCLLGDVTDDIEYYEKSWYISKQRFARAKKSIGTYHYVRKQYAEAIENYELALSVNPSNVSILSLLAYCCLTLERYERAAECYRNITYNDDGNFLAWNNLSKAYLKLNQKERAWRTLREAIKCNYEEWKIWENFMVVSADLGAFDDVILAWHRLIDIKSAHRDDLILNRLTYALTCRSSNKVDVEYMKLLNDALKLAGRLNSTSECSPRFWLCYYKLLIKEFELSQMKLEREGKEFTKLDLDSRISKITNALQRATPTSLMSAGEWSQMPEKASRLLDIFHELVDCYQYAFELIGQQDKIWRQWKYLKLSIENSIETLRRKGYSNGQQLSC